MGQYHFRKVNDGAALIAALGFLAIFTMLGLAYARQMVLRADEISYDRVTLQTREAAAAGVTSAIDAIRAARAAGNELPAAYEFTLPLYKFDRTAKDTDFITTNDTRTLTVRVEVLDESGRLNLNHASTRMIQAVLGISGEDARKLQSSLPRNKQEESTAWFTHVDDLVVRNLIDKESLDAADKNLLTVYSVIDQNNPVGYFNVNTMPIKLLAPLLGISEEEAEKVAAMRPFASLDDLTKATGKSAETFALRRGADVGSVLGSELCFKTSCYRIRATARYSEAAILGAGEKDLRRRLAEAVVVFDDSDRAAIVYWDLGNAAGVPIPVAANSTDEAPADEQAPSDEVAPPAEAAPTTPPTTEPAQPAA